MDLDENPYLWQASVILAVNASILAVPGLGAPSPTKTLCSISFILSVFCIVACTIAQHFGYRLRSLDFAVRTSLSIQRKYWPDVTNSIGILLTGEDGESCDPCKHTQFSVSHKVTKALIAITNYSHFRSLQLGIFYSRVSRRNLHRWIRASVICKDHMRAGPCCWDRSHDSIDDGQFWSSWAESMMTHYVAMDHAHASCINVQLE